ncbi:hypothetical protein [Bosea sp. (in: a-proteobacteria)]|uniref:hypothetical protein n=1 Tax=Bosea sp. (in: a-proteobacteria) TaxID=1871050 RepID=UPI001AD5578A|nr:hypothetical protein [Bosea sp. (in: a-proteobacteria)]MBN9437158.1 hypothetical protein [Bosea sp. (in: a-proteobacteria)]
MLIEFDYPFRSNQETGFVPSLRQIFKRGLRSTSNGIFISDAKAFAEAVDWVRTMLSKAHYRIEGRYEKVVCQTKEGEEIVVDGDGVRWGVVFRFLRDQDAVLFKLRFG